jgi:hypothetical protein
MNMFANKSESQARRYRGTVFLICFAVYSLGMPLESAALSLARGPYLQMETSTSISVRWRTDLADNGRVRYGTDRNNLIHVADNVTQTTEHVVNLSSLTPATKYYYSVGTTTETLGGADNDHFFVTAPPTGAEQSTHIWVIGDSGTNNDKARAVRDAYLEYKGDRYTHLWLMLGDNAYADGTDSEYQAAVFDMYPMLLRQTVLWPALGNHDGHSANSSTQSGVYFNIFSLPKQAEAGGVASGTEAYYAFDYGNIHFIVLDSQESSREVDGEMLTWLKNDLAATTQTWIIAYWHYPPYTKGSHDSDTSNGMSQMRKNVLPILEEAGVDLVLSGHSHSYERSFLINEHYGQSDTFKPTEMLIDGGDGRIDGNGAYVKADRFGRGAIYAVAGSSGKTGGGTLDHPVMYASLNLLGSMILDVNGTVLDATFLDNTGSVRDYFRIMKPPRTTVIFQNGISPSATYFGTTTTWLSEKRADQNFGSSASVRIDGEDSSEMDRYGLLKWDLSSIPAGSQVQSVTITFKVTDGHTGRYELYKMKRPWIQDEATWNDYAEGAPWEVAGAKGKLDHGSAVMGTIDSAASGSYTLKLNSAGVGLVQLWVDKPQYNHGFIVDNRDNENSLSFWSVNATTPSYRPKMTVTYVMEN